MGIAQELLDSGVPREALEGFAQRLIAEHVPDPESVVRERGWSIALFPFTDSEIGPAYAATINGNPDTTMVARTRIDALRSAVFVYQQSTAE